ncbi:MAG: hypothetical protein IJO32_04350 [Bacilli bacterium]|nr:hypothetical protein [Bacilli bacterium]
MEKIINVLPLSTIIENDLFKENDLYFNNLVSIETENNIEYNVKPLESLIELYQKDIIQDSKIIYGYVMDETKCNMEIVEDKIITLIQGEDNKKYLIVNEPKDSHNMNKLYIKKL